MSEHEQRTDGELEAEETIRDLDVPADHADDVTGGREEERRRAGRSRRRSSCSRRIEGRAREASPRAAPITSRRGATRP